MVRFRLSGDGLSTFEGSVAGESALVVDRWSSGKGLALTSSRENAILSICFAFALSVRPRVSPTPCLGARVRSFGEAPALSSDCMRDIRRDAVNNPSAPSTTGSLSSRETLEFRGNFDAWSFLFDVRTDDGLGAGEGGADSASVGAASRSTRRNGSSGTRLGRIRPLGADATSTGDGSTSPPNATAEAPCDFRSNPTCGDLVSDDGARGPNVVASLGRRRISTVNEGTARLNVFPDTADGWADFVLPKTTLRGKAQQSNRRRGPCWSYRHQETMVRLSQCPPSAKGDAGH